MEGVRLKAQYESSVKQFKVQFDISEEEPADYQDLIALTLSYDQGETLDTWQDLYNFLSNNVKTGLDPTWSVSVKLDKSSPVCQFILAKEYAVGAEATAKTRIINLLKGTKGKQIDFTATLSSITYEATAEEVLQVDFDLKVYDNSSFEETDYSPAA
jgi:hypothetical protein|nr:MAG TPA: hypothetical protein [Caudoviricetes sp.]